MVFWRSILVDPQTAPWPLFCTTNKIGTPSVSFAVPHDLIKVIVGLDREGLVSALIDVAVSNHVVVRQASRTRTQCNGTRTRTRKSMLTRLIQRTELSEGSIEYEYEYRDAEYEYEADRTAQS